MTNKITKLTLRKKVWKYTRDREVFTSLELRMFLDIPTEETTAKGIVITNLLKELVYWEYLSAIKEGRTVKYYVNL